MRRSLEPVVEALSDWALQWRTGGVGGNITSALGLERVEAPETP